MVLELIIYKIQNNINDKVYIGQTVRELDVRLNEHLRSNSSISGRAMRKYGMDNFTIEIIDNAENMKDLNKKEIYWIEYYNSISPNGYNLTIGGEGTMGYEHTEETRLLQSELKEGMYFGKDNPFYGRTHSDKQKSKWSRDRKGRNLDKARSVMLKNHRRKVRNIDTCLEFDSIKEAGEYYDIAPTHITRVCKGKQNTTHGFRWEYI